MRPTALLVHNYRSLLDVRIELHPYMLIVGPNNSGKSNLIAAIRAFYDDLKFDADRDLPKCSTQDEESWVELHFALTEDEKSALDDSYLGSHETLRIRKYFSSTEKDAAGYTRSGYYSYKEDSLSGDRFQEKKNVKPSTFGTVVYVPAVSKLSDQTKLTGPSPLRDLLNAVLRGIVESSDAYKELVAAFEEFESKLKKAKGTGGYSLANLEEDVSGQLKEWGHRFNITVNSIPADDIVKTVLGYTIYDPATQSSLNSESFGQGLQRHLIYTLIRLASERLASSPSSAGQEFAGSLTWLLFEEPEAYLHPSQIAVLNRSLIAFSDKTDWQVLATTHNPEFASRNLEQLSCLVRLHRSECETTVGQIAAAKIDEVLAANQKYVEDLKAAGESVEEEDVTLEMEGIKYSLWLNPRRASAFFAHRCLLVEGPTEYGLIECLLADGRLTLPQGGLVVLDTLGKFNTHRFMNLFGALRIPHAVLYDGDKGNKKSAILGQAIQDAVNDYTTAVDSFDTDIEDFLAIPRAKKPHRKPQNVLWHVKAGKVPDTALDALCSKLQALIDA